MAPSARQRTLSLYQARIVFLFPRLPPCVPRHPRSLLGEMTQSVPECLLPLLGLQCGDQTLTCDANEKRGRTGCAPSVGPDSPGDLWEVGGTHRLVTSCSVGGEQGLVAFCSQPKFGEKA